MLTSLCHAQKHAPRQIRLISNCLLTELLYISALSIIIPLSFGIILYKSLTLALKILLIYILSLGIFELWTAILFLNKFSNIFLFHIQVIVEFALLSFLYIKLHRHRSARWILGIVSIVFTLYFFGSVMTTDLSEFNSLNRIIESCVLIAFFVSYIISGNKRSKVPYIEMNPYFILTFGLIIYFSGTAFVFLFANHLDDNSFLPTWTIHSILNIFVNIIYASVIWRSRQVLNT